MGKLQGWKTSNDQVDEGAKIVNWMILEGGDQLAPAMLDDDDVSPSSSSLSSSDPDYDDEDDDDDDDDGSCGSSNGPLYELSELLLQLPIKRGLSKYYQGKSQSFKNLGSVKRVEDFAKEMSSKKFGRSRTKSYTTTPKPIICKKSTSSLPFSPSIARR